MATANENMEHFKSAAVQPTENLKQGLRDVGRTVSDIAHQTAEDARRLGGDVVGRVSDQAVEVAERVSQKASEVAERGKQQAQQLEHRLEERIKQQPLTAVLAGAGIGIVIGMLLRRS